MQAKSIALEQQVMEIVVHVFHITVGVVFVDVIATNAMLCMSGIWCLLVVAVLVSAPQKETQVSIR